MIHLAIPTFNRGELTYHSYRQVLGNSRLSSVTIVDDCSEANHHPALMRHRDADRVRVHFNAVNYGCYLNKRNAVSASPGDWVLLLDSDNEIDSRYLSALENVSPWSPTVLYLPTFAAPVHDYRAYDDQTYDAFSIRQMIDKPRFLTALNTGNFFFNRESFLKIFDATSQPLAADSLYMVYRWLSNGGSIRFVSGAHYHHTHNSRDGNYNRYAERSATKFDRIIRAMRDGKWGEYVID